MATFPYQTLLDNFNDNSYNNAIWDPSSLPAGIVESGGKLNLNATGAYPEVTSKASIDLSTGIVAAKLTSSGTPNASTEFYFSVYDNAGNYVQMQSTPNSGFWNFTEFGAPTISSVTKLDSTMWSDWNQGDWIGLGDMSGTTIRVYKSSDGTTWNEMGSCTVGGTFNKGTASLDVQAGCFSGTVDWNGIIDDASFFSTVQPSTNWGGFFSIM
jgi:hypothetical protein